MLWQAIIENSRDNDCVGKLSFPIWWKITHEKPGRVLANEDIQRITTIRCILKMVQRPQST